MAKAALEALAATLAKEERRNNIHVNVVAPGLVDTEMGRRLVKGAMGVDDIRTMDKAQPLRARVLARGSRGRRAVPRLRGRLLHHRPAHRRRRRKLLTVATPALGAPGLGAAFTLATLLSCLRSS